MFFKIFLATWQQMFSGVQSFFCYPEMRKNAQAGFTLVELMTVISIMALIGSITLANTLEAKRFAQDTKVIQDMKSIIKVVQAYYLDHGYFPSLTAAQASSPANTYASFGCPAVKICDYFSENEGTTCNGWNPCLCKPNPDQKTERLQMGWLPMVDGTFGVSDAYFSPQSTPRDDKQANCESPHPLIPWHYYKSGFNPAEQRYTVFMVFQLKRPRSSAPGKIQGCSATFCFYYIKETDISL